MSKKIVLLLAFCLMALRLFASDLSVVSSKDIAGAGEGIAVIPGDNFGKTIMDRLVIVNDSPSTNNIQLYDIVSITESNGQLFLNLSPAFTTTTGNRYKGVSFVESDGTVPAHLLLARESGNSIDTIEVTATPANLGAVSSMLIQGSLGAGAEAICYAPALDPSAYAFILDETVTGGTVIKAGSYSYQAGTFSPITLADPFAGVAGRTWLSTSGSYFVAQGNLINEVDEAGTIVNSITLNNPAGYTIRGLEGDAKRGSLWALSSDGVNSRVTLIAVTDPEIVVTTLDDTATETGTGYTGRFGHVVTSGDFNGDGYDDVVKASTFWGEANSSAFNDPPKGSGVLAIYWGSATGVSETNRQVIEGPLPGKAYWGSSDSWWTYSATGVGPVRKVGDVNGDGFEDLGVCAPLWNSFFVYYGSSNGIVVNGNAVNPSGATVWSPQRVGTYDGVGLPSRAAHAINGGDVDGDGYSDVLVSSPAHKSWASFGKGGGTVWVYFGSATGLKPNTECTVLDLSTNTTPAYGTDICVADVDGDKIGDVVVSLPFWNSIWVYKGKKSSIGPRLADNAQPDATFNFASTGITCPGWALANAGDVDNDGCEDIVIGAPNLTNGGYQNGGAVAVLFGDNTGAIINPNPWIYQGRHYTDGAIYRAGYAMSVAGGVDVNGDGCTDIVVGENNNYSKNYESYIHVFYGQKGKKSLKLGRSLNPAISYRSDLNIAMGDFNGDKIGDVLTAHKGVGAHLFMMPPKKPESKLIWSDTVLTEPVGGFGVTSIITVTINGPETFNQVNGIVNHSNSSNNPNLVVIAFQISPKVVQLLAHSWDHDDPIHDCTTTVEFLNTHFTGGNASNVADSKKEVTVDFN